MKRCTFDHCAIRVNEIEKVIELFEKVFGMTIKKTEMKDSRIFQVWFDQGIQLINTTSAMPTEPQIVDHIGIRIGDVDACLEIAKEFGAKALPKGKNWIVFPFGLCIEVLPFEEIKQTE